MRMGNPAMRRTLTKAENGQLAVEQKAATFGGIAAKSVYFAAVTILAGVVAVLLLYYALDAESEKVLLGLIVGAVASLFLMLILSLINMFAPSAVKVVGTLYSLCQGLLLGLIVCLINMVLPGVAFAAVLGTAIVFLVSVALNKSLSARGTNKLLKVVITGFISLLVVEVIVLIASMFMDAESAIRANYWVQFAITAFCVFYASVMLMWDLQTASDLVQCGADKRYEWNVAFALVTTLVYLYIELLELIVRLAIIFGKNKD